MVCEETEVTMQFCLENKILNCYLETNNKLVIFYADDGTKRA